MNRLLLTVAIASCALLPLACGGDESSDDIVTLVVYDSYPDDDAAEPNPLQTALDEFTTDTGIEVELLKSQDAGTMVSRA